MFLLHALHVLGSILHAEQAKLKIKKEKHAIQGSTGGEAIINILVNKIRRSNGVVHQFNFKLHHYLQCPHIGAYTVFKVDPQQLKERI